MDITRGKGNQLKNAIKDLERRLDSRLGPFLYLLIPTFLLIIALASRLYDLSNFPYFTNGWPMCGGFSCIGYPNLNPALSGLYSDEVVDFLASNSVHNIISDLGGGPVAPLLIALSTRILGTSVFAIRLPFAIISSICAVAVYVATNAITSSRISAILSALYFTVMMPALVYGRMVFGETVIALLFVIVFYSTIKISRSTDIGSSQKWFLVASLCSILSVLVKLNGVIVVIYFILFLSRAKLVKRGGSYIGFTLVLGVLFPLGLLFFFMTQPITSFFRALYLRWIFQMGNALNLPKFFFFDTLPSSGAPLFWGITGYPIPEFWYLFLYLALVVVVVFDDSSTGYSYSNLLLAIVTFAAVFSIFSEPFGSYWMVIIQPLLAIAFGPGIKRILKQMPLGGALAFYAFLFVPLATSLGMTLITPILLGYHNITNNYLFYWNLLVVVPPAALLLFTARMNVKNSAWRTWSNAVLLVAFFTVLIAATFFIADLYPYYI